MRPGGKHQPYMRLVRIVARQVLAQQEHLLVDAIDAETARFTRPIACSTSARRGLRRTGGWRSTFRTVTPPANPPGLVISARPLWRVRWTDRCRK